MTRARDLASGQNGVRPYAMAAGIASLPSLAAGASSGVTVTFPVNRFTQAPMVTASNTSTDYVTACPNAVSTTSFVFYSRNVYTLAAGASVGNWIAVQMTSGAGNG